MTKKQPARPKTAKRNTAKRKTAKRKTATLKTTKPKTAKVQRSFFRTESLADGGTSWGFPQRKAGERWYWLVKQEPSVFSFDDLQKAPNKTTNWNGVRNPVARNFIRDQMKQGDHAFFYHSNADPSAVVGIVEIVREAYPDETQFDAKSDYYDAGATRDNPKWFQVDVRATEKLPREVSLEEIKGTASLASLVLLHISRLSVQPVTPDEWRKIVALARG